MRISHLFTKTSKTVPADEVAKNAQLLIRAGYVYKVMAGVYAYTPLGLRVLEKIKRIVREEMNAIGGQELIMSSLQKRETWEETGRWDDETVDVWFKSNLKDGTEVGFGWSHEEAIIEMMKHHLKSYKDFPVSVYQFQTKLRNELRAKSGIMRGREFVMKDMYSMATNRQQHEDYYNAVSKAYERVFERFGIGEDTYVTFASGGAFTQFSHEFQTICQAGEDTIFQAPSTKETFNEEVAPAQAPHVAPEKETLPLEEVKGEGMIGVEALATFLNIPVEKTTKTMLYVADDGRMVAAVVRGGYTINEEKLCRVLNVNTVRLADEATVKRITGAEVGYAGLINLPDDVQVIVDESCAGRQNFEIGANHTNHHHVNVNWGRDLPEPETYYDIKVAKRGDIHPDTGEVYEVFTSAEVGNIFNFGTQKSEDTHFTFTNPEGKDQYVYLGSYGIGITRLMGVIVEKFADERGIVWPEATAPFTVYVVRLGQDEKVVQHADHLYDELQANGIEVLYDDRDERPGTKFADAELIGIPYRITVSERLIATNTYEWTPRNTGATELLTHEELLAKLS